MDAIDLIQKYISVITTLVLIIATWVKMISAIEALKNRDDLQDKELQEVKRDMKANNLLFTQLQVDIQAIKTAIEYIKNEVSKK